MFSYAGGWPVKVIHCHNIAGVPSTLVKYQQRLGIDAALIVRRKHGFGFPENQLGRFKGARTLMSADVVHYHSTSWIEGPVAGIRNPDAKLLSFVGKPIVAHFHGEDLRRSKIRPSFRADHTLVSTPDLLERVPQAEWLPNPIDLELFSPRETKHPDVVRRVGYYAPNWSGTYVPVNEIERAISTLQKDGLHVEAAPVGALAYDQMPDYYRSLAILVDKLEGGFYGLMGCEAAASGIAVIANTSKVRSQLIEEPFYEFTGSLTEDLRHLLQDDAERTRIANRGREYVEAKHEASKVARRTIEIYQSIT
jgi:hypothetical protein